ncbi:MAG: pyruvate dehydrogenase complex dihydrolipoamide acetyltransferase [Alphaproteobacteria bacterium]|nr:pyruvate dehydrogenase complex dihydrolipoamide acetyltransferase [Alphaproteobacteria bacterium]
MPITILMPALSPTMTEGNLAKWHKKEGDKVKAGDLIAEIETDKAIMEVEAVDEGILGRILVPEKTENVKVNQPIALILEEGENADSLKDFEVVQKPQSKSANTADIVVLNQLTAQKVESLSSGKENRIFASPLAKRIASQKNIALDTIQGSGPHGRIIRQDVENYQPVQKAVGAIAEIIPHTLMRKTIAKRLVEAKSTIPHFYLTLDCDITDLVALRAQFNALKEDQKISINDFLIRASALALQKVPGVNASWSEEGIIRHPTSDVSVAVSVPNGLITPIIFNAHDRNVSDISVQMKDYVARAKLSKLKPEEYQGGTFSLSNLGMFGIKDFAAIINPPQSAILAVGAGIEMPVVKNGAIVIRSMMSCTLSVDHRVIDGSMGAQFLSVFENLVENPLSLLS